MSLWCSVLGHDFGPSVVENEHERRGDSMVFSVVEYEECERCGERNVISENTRTTRIDDVPEATDSDPGDAGTEADSARERGVSVVDEEGKTAKSADADTAPPSKPGQSIDPVTDESSPTPSDGVRASGSPDDGVEIIDSRSSPSTSPDQPEDAAEDGHVAGSGTRGEGDSATERPEETSTEGSDPEQAEERPDSPDSEEGVEIMEADEPHTTSADRSTPRETSNHDEDQGGESTPAEREATETTESPVTDDAEILEEDSADAHGGWPDPELAETTPSTEEEPGPRVEDDAEILEEEAGRAHGEWPEQDREGDGGDPYNRPLTPGSDGIIEAPDETTEESEPVEEPPDQASDETSEGPMGIERPESEDPIDEDDPSELYCPQCSFVEPSGRSSLRTGDICPECHRGYLGERRR